MKLISDYQGWAHIKEGISYCSDNKWNDLYFLCRYIIYNNEENTVKIYKDNSKIHFDTYVRNNNFDFEDNIFVLKQNTFSHNIIKIISLEDFCCNVNRQPF